MLLYNLYFYTSSSRNHVHVRPEIGREAIGGENRKPRILKKLPYDRVIFHGLNSTSHSPFFLEICARNYLCRNGFSFGMSAAFRVPLRAFANPATAIRQTSTTSIASPALSLGAVRPSSLPLGSIASKLWSLQSSEVRSQTTSFSRCFSTRNSPLRSAEENVTKNEGVKSKPGPSQSKKPIALLVVLGLLGVGAAVYSEELKHGYGAARRSGRVVGTLAVCINE